MHEMLSMGADNRDGQLWKEPCEAYPRKCLFIYADNRDRRLNGRRQGWCLYCPTLDV
jgi:hypothetical protein